jgi:hypothetical protein
MNSLDSPKLLKQHVWQLIENSFPGLSGKPRNGVNEILSDGTQLGYGTNHSLFRPHAIHMNAGGKDFIFAITRTDHVSYKREYAIEVWNITDVTRTRLEYGLFSADNVYFGFQKLYNALYLVFDYEITTNHTSSYRTKNKIIEYINGAWTVREMGIDCVPELGPAGWENPHDLLLPVNLTLGTALVFKNKLRVIGQTINFYSTNDCSSWESDIFSNPSPDWASVTLVYKGKLWSIGGTTFGRRVINSSDGITWAEVGSSSFPVAISMAAGVVFNNKMWVVGGSVSSSATRKVYYSEDGITWTEAGTNAIPNAIRSHTCLLYNGKIWAIGGINADSPSRKVFYSLDGTTWAEAGTNSLPTDGCYLHSSVVYNNKMYVIGGYVNGANSRKVLYSTDGITWTETTPANALPVATSQSAACVFNNSIYVIGGYVSDAVDDIYISTDGQNFITTKPCVPKNKFYSLSWIFVRHTDSSSKQGALASYKYVNWKIVNGRLIPGPNEILLPGTIVASSGLIAGTGTDFTNLFVQTSGTLQVGTVTIGNGGNTFLRGTGTDFTKLTAGNYLKLAGLANPLKITSITNATLAVVVNPDNYYDLSGLTFQLVDQTKNSVLRAYGSSVYNGIQSLMLLTAIISATSARYDLIGSTDGCSSSTYALAPSLDAPINMTSFLPSDCDGVEDLDLRRSIYPSVSAATAILVLTLPNTSAAVAQEATHLRYFRTLGDADADVAAGLSHRFIADISLSGTIYDTSKIFVDDLTDGTLEGETNILDMTGVDVPPQGRYIIWAGGRLWIGGNPANPGYWFCSDTPTNLQYPKSAASRFMPGSLNVTCEPYDGQKDTGCCLLGGDLYFFKERKIFVLDNASADNVPRKISDSIGCACPQTLVTGDIPTLGGNCALFLSESGPAMLLPGGKVRLLVEHRISELWPSKTGFLKLASGLPTDWYTRNKIYSSFWNSTWYLFGGDSRDTECQLIAGKYFGFQFGNDGESVGAFQFTFPCLNFLLYEPQLLIPVDNIRAYTLSHRFNDSSNVKYRLHRFLDPAKFQDTYLSEGAIAYSMKFQTRYLYSGALRCATASGKCCIVYITFVDTAGLTITVCGDGSRLTSECTFSQVRQSGIRADNTCRHFIMDLLQAGMDGISFFDVLISKVVPSTGAVEFFGQELIITDVNEYPKEEFMSAASVATGATVHVEKADATPEVPV